MSRIKVSYLVQPFCSLVQIFCHLLSLLILRDSQRVRKKERPNRSLRNMELRNHLSGCPPKTRVNFVRLVCYDVGFFPILVWKRFYLDKFIPYIGTNLWPGSSSRDFTRSSRWPSTPWKSWHVSNTLSWTFPFLLANFWGWLVVYCGSGTHVVRRGRGPISFYLLFDRFCPTPDESTFGDEHWTIRKSKEGSKPSESWSEIMYGWYSVRGTF